MAFSDYLHPIEEEIDRVQAEILEIQEQIRLERQRREAAEAAKLAAENRVVAAERVTELMRLLLRDGRINEATNLDSSTPAYQQLLEEYGLL